MRVAVVGAGVVGLSTTAALLERGVDAVCYERSGVVMSERSAGSSRIFRLAHPTPELVRLAQLARVGFREWEKIAGTPMVSTSGCVISGDTASGWAAAMKEAGAPYEVVEGASERLRLPAREPPSEALLDPSGGVVNVERCAGPPGRTDPGRRGGRARVRARGRLDRRQCVEPEREGSL